MDSELTLYLSHDLFQILKAWTQVSQSLL